MSVVVEMLIRGGISSSAEKGKVNLICFALLVNFDDGL
jgi:hypothetical protein